MDAGQTRYENFIDLQNHPMLGKVVNRLNDREFGYCIIFLGEHKEASKGDFEHLVNRMFMDAPELRARYPHWKEITELLLCANSKLTDEVPNEPNAAKLTEALRFGPKK